MWIIYLKQKKNTIRDSQYIYQNELGKARFQHDMVYGDFKDLPIRTISDKVLHDKAFSIAKNRKYDGYQREHASLVYRFFDKKSLGSYTSGGAVKCETMPNQELAEELHITITIIRKTEKQKIYSSFTYNKCLGC